MGRRAFSFVAAVFLYCLMSPLALAQGLPGTESEAALTAEQLQTQPLSAEAIRELVARLDDAAVRDILIQQLDARALPSQPEGAELDALLLEWRDEAEEVRDGFSALFQAYPKAPAAIAAAIQNLPDQGSAMTFFWLGLGFAAMVLVGWGVERGTRWALRRIWAQTAETAPGAALAHLGCLVMRFVLEFVFLAAFIAGALATFFALWQGNEVTRNVVMAYLTALITVRIFVIFSHVLLSPRRAWLRLTHMEDREAKRLHRQNIVLASIAAFGFLTCSLLEQLGIGADVHSALNFMVGVVLFGTLVISIIRSRGALTGDLAWDRESSSRFRLLFADAWPGIAATYVVALYVILVVVAFTGGGGSYLAAFGSLLTVLFLPHIDAIIERAAQRLEQNKEMLEKASGQIRIVLLRAGRIVGFIAAVLFLMKIWGVDVFTLAEASVGSRVAGALVDIGLTALIAYLLWELARIAIERKLAEEGAGDESGAAEPGEMGGAGSSRLLTLLPLLRITVQVTIIVMAGMLILSSLGVDIGPLLAGAGVIGLAVGFGAQTLVRDIVSGVFFLVDDAFRVGEYIDVGGVAGTVEKISIRSLRLRHHLGALHTVPFGEIQQLTNMSRDWAIMKLQFRVPFDTDLEKVRKIFKRIGQEMLENEDYGSDFIQPFKSQGVKTTDDSAFVIRGKFMTKPGKQFVIRRLLYQAVQKAFAEEGIQFADRRVTVNVPGAEHMEPEERAAAEKAAASAVASAEAARAEAAASKA